MAKVPVAYVVRHGTTELNSQGKFRGDKDIPLDAKGRKDAQQAAEFLKDKDLGNAYSSDLSRAKDTAKAVVGDKFVDTTENLRPLDVGNLAGKKKSEHMSEIAAIQKDHSLRLPGSDENLADFDQRIRHPLLKAFHAGIRTGKPSVVFTHASVIHGLGHLLHNDHEHNLVKPGGIVQVSFNGKDFIAEPVFKSKKAPDGYAS